MDGRTHNEAPTIKLSLKIVSLIFGLGSWIAITGFWVELPVLIQKLPEGWALASYLTVMIQAANVGPLVYYVLRKMNWCSEVVATHVQMLIGVVACALLIPKWDSTVYLWGQQRSLVLFIAAFGLAIVDCTSSVTFLPFMARFRSCYLTPYLIGEETFFTSLLITLLTSWTAFILLLISPAAKQEQHFNEQKASEISRTLVVSDSSKVIDEGERKEEECIMLNEISMADSNFGGAVANSSSRPENRISSLRYWHFQALMAWCCLATFGLMPPLQPYSSLPYGNQVLHYVVILVGLAYPGGCFLAMFLQTRSLLFIDGLTLLGSLVAVYIFCASLMSPYPPFQSTNRIFGGILMVFSWVVFTAVLSYVKTMITVILNDHGGSNALFWVGMFTQIGSAFGAAFMLLAVEYFHWFKDRCLQ
ncbi:Riboflavin transporter 2-A-like protein [Dinothrombium tinctorium]|uniref:Riboflavin transporter n=1 Tax=Dinothrombium tinctorium TaxID=1965070 RepID=A0A443R1J7_9ACAR|nr:Riboflavin transporter 2-A-like protein [Dinothrombium tinctorium]